MISIYFVANGHNDAMCCFQAELLIKLTLGFWGKSKSINTGGYNFQDVLGGIRTAELFTQTG